MRQHNPAARYGGVHSRPRRRPPIRGVITSGITWEEGRQHPPVPDPSPEWLAAHPKPIPPPPPPPKPPKPEFSEETPEYVRWLGILEWHLEVEGPSMTKANRSALEKMIAKARVKVARFEHALEANIS